MPTLLGGNNPSMPNFTQDQPQTGFNPLAQSPANHIPSSNPLAQSPVNPMIQLSTFLNPSPPLISNQSPNMPHLPSFFSSAPLGQNASGSGGGQGFGNPSNPSFMPVAAQPFNKNLFMDQPTGPVGLFGGTSAPPPSRPSQGGRKQKQIRIS